MTRMTKMTLMCAVAMAVVVAQSQAEIIGQAAWSSAGGSYGIDTSGLEILATMGGDYYDPPTVTLFDTALLATDIGTTLSMAPGVDFDTAVDLLTNGLEDIVRFTVAGGSGGSSEHYRFSLDPGVTDFAGYNIDAIDLEIISFSKESPGSDPNGNGLWTSHTFEGNLIILGSPIIPEPATGALLALGLAGLAGGRSRWALSRQA